MARKAAADFEEQLKRLQEIVTALESGEASLERGVALYKEGVSLARRCREQLQNARNEIRVFSAGAFEPFDASGNAENMTEDALDRPERDNEGHEPDA